MKTIDIYTTPTCGFCKALKGKLDGQNIPYTSHDVTANEKDFADMRELSGGAMSVPVTVLNKGTENQKVLIGYPSSVKAIGLEDEANAKNEQKDTSTLTCPKCGHKQQGEIPTTACVPFYICEGCKETIKAQGEDCCVFCSYADKQCPLKKKESDCSNEACKI